MIFRVEETCTWEDWDAWRKTYTLHGRVLGGAVRATFGFQRAWGVFMMAFGGLLILLGLLGGLVNLITLIGAAALLAGAAVSFAGLISFVGLLVPHIARRLVGVDHRVLLPACALLGAIFLLVCDTAARTLFAPYELPVGILLNVIGGVFFLYLLLGRKRGRVYD